MIHQFVIERDDEEITLEAEFLIQEDYVDGLPSVASIDSIVYVVDGEGNRTEFLGTLTEEEEERACDGALAVSGGAVGVEDEYEVDSGDSFRDDRAVAVSGLGKAFL